MTHTDIYFLGSIASARLAEGVRLVHGAPVICHGLAHNISLWLDGLIEIALEGTVYHSEYKSRESEEGDVPICPVEIGVNVNVHISPDCIVHSP